MAVIAAGLGTPWLWSLVVTGSTVFAGGSLGVMRGASLIFTYGFLNLWILSTENKLPYVNRWFQACIISEGDKIFPTFYRAVAPGDEECSRSIDLFYMCLSCSSFSIKLILGLSQCRKDLMFISQVLSTHLKDYFWQRYWSWERHFYISTCSFSKDKLLPCQSLAPTYRATKWQLDPREKAVLRIWRPSLPLAVWG